jgi:hypothetical protein
VTFRRVSSNGGAAPGLTLANTGTGGFTLTGDGGAANNGSGGIITGKSGSGIDLSGVNNVRLNRVDITNNLGDGISGNDVNGLQLHRVDIANKGDTTVADNGIEMTRRQPPRPRQPTSDCQAASGLAARCRAKRPAKPGAPTPGRRGSSAG